MNAGRTPIFAFALALLGGAVSAAPQARAASDLASPWIQLHNARARMTAGPPAVRAAKAYLAGVEVTLDEGWKTYWRMPGDAGVPPNFDWSGSSNVGRIEVRYPSPTRMSEPAAETVGYKHSVLFPIEIVPKDPSRPVSLVLAMEFGVCREICIPAEAKFNLTLVPPLMTGQPSPEMLAALDQVPRAQSARRPQDPSVSRATAALDGTTPRLTILARFPHGDRGADLFVEAPDGLYVPMTKRLPDVGETGAARAEADASSGLARFEVDLSRTGNAQEFKGKTLKLTLVSAAGASETAWTVP